VGLSDDIEQLNGEIDRLKAVVDELEQTKYDGLERDLIEALAITPRYSKYGTCCTYYSKYGGGDEQPTDHHHTLSTREHHPFMKQR